MSEKTKSNPNHTSEIIPDGSPTLAFDINIGRRLPQGTSVDVDYDALNRVAREKLSPKEIEDISIEVKDALKDEFVIQNMALGQRAIALPIENLNRMYPYAIATYADELHDAPSVQEQTMIGALGVTSEGLMSRPSKTIESDPYVAGLLIATPEMVIATRALAGRTKSNVDAEKFMNRHKRSGAFSVPKIARYSGRHRHN